MNAFLVQAGCMMDNVPLGLFATLEAAQTFARPLTEADVKKVAHDVFGISASQCCFIEIITFVDSYPVSRELVKDLDI